jgi:hypothetical protein
MGGLHVGAQKQLSLQLSFGEREIRNMCVLINSMSEMNHDYGFGLEHRPCFGVVISYLPEQISLISLRSLGLWADWVIAAGNPMALPQSLCVSC